MSCLIRRSVQFDYKLLEDFVLTRENARQAFKASTTVLAVIQGLATVAVTGLGIAAATLDPPPKVLNVLTAALGAVGTGVVSLSKWRDYSGKTTFNEEAMSFYQVGVGNTQSLLSEHQVLPQPATILMRACTAARGLEHPQKGSPGVQYQSARTFLNRRKYSNIRCGCCTIYL